MTAAGPSATDLVVAALRLPSRLEGDAAFADAAGWWSGTLGLVVDDECVGVRIVDGQVHSAAVLERAAGADVSFGGSVQAWRAHLAGSPLEEGGLERTGDRGQFWQYYAAIGRVLEVYAGLLGSADVGGEADG